MWARKRARFTVHPTDAILDERLLVEGLLADDAAATTAFVERTHHAVYSLACRMTHDADLRHDWTQEVLLGVLADLRAGRFAYQRPGGFWAWFRKRAYYRLLDEYRRHRRRALHEVHPGSGCDEDVISQFPGGEDPVAEVERAEVLATVELCIDKLRTPRQRRALTFLLLDDMTYDAIAEAMGAPLNTVKAWIRRGRVALRRCIAAALGLREPGELETAKD